MYIMAGFAGVYKTIFNLQKRILRMLFQVEEIYFQIKKKHFIFKATDIFEIQYKLCRWHALTK